MLILHSPLPRSACMPSCYHTSSLSPSTSSPHLKYFILLYNPDIKIHLLALKSLYTPEDQSTCISGLIFPIKHQNCSTSPLLFSFIAVTIKPSPIPSSGAVPKRYMLPYGSISVCISNSGHPGQPLTSWQTYFWVNILLQWQSASIDCLRK